MLSFLSSQKIRITSWLSTPDALQMFPISLANATLSPWKQLQAYLTISAVRTGTTCTGASIPA